MPKPKLLKKTKTLALDDEGALRVVVVADTHSEPHPRTDELIAALEPDHILHAGDIGDLAVVDRLARIAPTTAVRGNIDVHADLVPDVFTIDVRDRADPDDPEAGDSLFKILLLHIGVNGPRIRADAARLARAEGAKLVICGHSHVPFIGRDRDLSVFNPGSIGPRRFPLPIVFGVMDVSPQRVDLKHIDCETGQRWLP
ncbi:MAG: putative phosphoesterase [Labilithrix sp.]|nr:putative phosphoesterase [Labilithrix sp.]